MLYEIMSLFYSKVVLSIFEFRAIELFNEKVDKINKNIQSYVNKNKIVLITKALKIN